MEPTLIEIEPKGKSKAILPFEGEIMGYIIDEEVILNYGNKKFEVKKGQTFYFSADKVSYLENVKNKKNY